MSWRSIPLVYGRNRCPTTWEPSAFCCPLMQNGTYTQKGSQKCINRAGDFSVPASPWLQSRQRCWDMTSTKKDKRGRNCANDSQIAAQGAPARSGDLAQWKPGCPRLCIPGILAGPPSGPWGSASPSTGLCLGGIFVERQARARGIGKMLLDHVKGLHDTLWLHVYQQNRGAVAFYLREGFSIATQGVDEDTGQPEYTMTWSASEN